MNPWVWMTLAALGAVTAFVVGYAWAAARRAAEVRALAEEGARAREQAERVPVLERKADELERERAALQSRLAESAKAAEAERDKTAWVADAGAKLREAFQALASEALRANAEQLTARAREQVVAPLEQGLRALDEHVRELERKREGAYGSLTEQLTQLREAHRQLRDTTSGLATALTTSSGTRGQWGEVQLRRIVEMAGMVRHVDFEEQERAESGKPDLVVRLPRGGVVPVDAKTPLKSYLETTQPGGDPAAQRERLAAHAAAVRGRIRELSGREYWKQYDHAPEFAVLFVPHEGFLSTALEADGDLMEFAFSQRVVLATPTSLLALLRTIAYGWQQHQMAEHAQEIAAQARVLVERLGAFAGHLQRTGRALDAAVRAYNDGVGSWQARLLPAAHQLSEMGAGGEDPPALVAVDRQPALLPQDEGGSPEKV